MIFVIMGWGFWNKTNGEEVDCIRILMDEMN